MTMSFTFPPISHCPRRDCWCDRPPLYEGEPLPENCRRNTPYVHAVFAWWFRFTFEGVGR